MRALTDRLLPAAVVSIVGIGISLATSGLVRQWEEARLLYEVEDRATVYGKILAHIPEMYAGELRSIGALYAASTVSAGMITEVTDGQRAVGRLGFQGFDPVVFTRPGNRGSHFA